MFQQSRQSQSICRTKSHRSMICCLRRLSLSMSIFSNLYELWQSHALVYVTQILYISGSFLHEIFLAASLFGEGLRVHQPASQRGGKCIIFESIWLKWIRRGTDDDARLSQRFTHESPTMVTQNQCISYGTQSVSLHCSVVIPKIAWNVSCVARADEAHFDNDVTQMSWPSHKWTLLSSGAIFACVESMSITEMPEQCVTRTNRFGRFVCEEIAD